MKYTIWINVVIGFWLVISAFTQHSELLRGVRMVNELAVALLLLCCALWYLNPVTTPRTAVVANVFVGGWLIVAPFVMSYGALNDVLCGIIAVVVALVAGHEVWGRTPA